jgi:hypothetical protein
MPTIEDIIHQQKLLAMYRGLLAEYLRQRELWERVEAPTFLSVGISTIRRHIMEVKGTLRAWKVTVENLPDDEGPDDDLAGEVAHQRKLLKIYRENLATHLKQRDQFAADLVPVQLIRGIDEQRSEIQRIKAILRGWSVHVEDLPGED